MNDPHVNALIYRLRHGDAIDYSKAQPAKFEGIPGLGLTVEKLSNGSEQHLVRFEMKDHYATEETARAAIEPFIKAWKLGVLLDEGPGVFDLDFLHSEIVDRNPSPGDLTSVSATLTLSSDAVLVREGKTTYPEPTVDLAVTPDVEAMALQYERYLEGRLSLGQVGYFCYDMFRRRVESKFPQAQLKVEPKILRTLSTLSTERGGQEEARKATGVGREFSATERKWIENVIKALIRHCAEIANDPTADFSPIRMSDFPDLSA